jgi:threonine/homoserine/homoserine lactone efflux protein
MALLFIVCRCCATFAAAASRRLRNVSRYRSLFVGHCCSLFVVAAQRLQPPLRGAFATFLVIVHYL